MFSLNHLLLATILISLTGAFLLDEREEDEEVLKEKEEDEVVLKEREKKEEVLIITGGFSSQGALSSVEVLATEIVLSTIIFLVILGHPTESASWCQLTKKKF